MIDKLLDYKNKLINVNIKLIEENHTKKVKKEENQTKKSQIEQNKIKIKKINKTLFFNCNHEWVEDYIDVDVEKTQYIKYCKHCELNYFFSLK